MRWFEVGLVVLTLLSGAIWLLDKWVLRRRRAARGDLLQAQAGDAPAEPWYVDYARAFFPVLAVVLVLRSFVAEPFRIPSSSMMPTLLIGDFILVNKFSYGLRLPITNATVVPLGTPARGDVVVFKPPHHPEQDWIKRVIGLPGDTVSYRGNVVSINGTPLTYATIGLYRGEGKGADMTGARLLTEQLPGRPHQVLEFDNAPLFVQGEGEWRVPAGHYFVMGDNRDNSEDGRFWGFLPESGLRGKAFITWLHCEGWFCTGRFDPSRIGRTIQ